MSNNPYNPILKENYGSKKKSIQHYADGGEVQQPEDPSITTANALGAGAGQLAQAGMNAMSEGPMPTGFLPSHQQEPSLQPDPIFNTGEEMLAGYGAAKLASPLMSAMEAAPSEFADIVGNQTGSINLSGPRRPIYTVEGAKEAPTAPGAIQKLMSAKGTIDPNAPGLTQQELAMAMQKANRPKNYADGGFISDDQMNQMQSQEPPTQGEQQPQVNQPEGFIPDSEFQSDEEKHGGALEQAKTFGEGALKGVIGPGGPIAEQALSQALFNQSPEETSANIRGREEANPMTSAAGEVAGLTGSMLTGAGEGALALKAGEAVAGKMLPEAASTMAKIGSRAVSDAIANMAITSSDEVTKMVLGDPNQSVETAATDLGLSGLIGGVVGGSVGGLGSLWESTLGPKASAALKAISDHLGGAEGRTAEPINEAIQKSGITLTDPQKAVLTGDSTAQQAYSDLLQSDVTKSGKEIQAQHADIKNQMADSIITSMGRDAKEAIPTEVSKYEHGKNIGQTLAKEYNEQVTPLSKEFEALKAKTAKAELIPDTEITSEADYTNPYNPKPGTTTKVPGTASKAVDAIAQLADKEGWSASPSSDIMQEVKRAIKEIPAQKTIKDLDSYISALGDNTASTLPFGQQTPLSRAGSLIKKELRNAVDEVTLQRLGEKEGPEAIERFKAARSAYAQQAQLKDYLNDYLKVGGSTASFGKGLKNMAQTDGEAVLNRLSGKNSADLLDFLGKNYPETAQSIKNYHIDSMLKSAADKAADGEKISFSALRNQVEKMSPELRSFTFSPETLSKIDSNGLLLDKITPKNYNFSNTARTITSAMQNVAPTALGAVAALSGHGGAAVLTGLLSKIMGHEVPDAMKLGLLKFMGSSKSIDAPAFKAMLDSITSSIKGDKLLSRAAKNVFKAETEVLPESMHPTERDRNKLQKQLDQFKTNPQSFMEAKNPVSHYMPDHGDAQSQTVARASQYLNSIKPATHQPTPLDTKIEPTTAQKNAYNHALDIANQPLIVMNRVKAGTATPADVAALKAMYPNLYNNFAKKLTNEMTEAVNKGQVISYRTKMGLSLFMGQPMDSTFTPASIQAAQPHNQPTQQAAAAQQQGPGTPQSKPKHSMNALNKLPAQYSTQNQAAEQRRTTNK